MNTSSNFSSLGPTQNPPAPFLCNGSFPTDELARDAFQRYCGCFISPPDFFTTFTELFFNRLFLVISLMGNLLVIVVLQRMKKGSASVRLRTNFLIQNLAVADMTVCLLYNLNEIYDKNPGNTTKHTCKAFAGLLFTSLSASSSLICCISIERYLAVVRPLDFELSQRKATLMVIFSWYYSLLFAIPDFYWMEKMDVNFCHVGLVPLCTYNQQPGTDTTVVSLVSVIATFIIPIAVIIFANASIIKTMLWSKDSVYYIRKKHVRNSSKSGQSGSNMKRRQSVVKIVLILTIVFVVCSVPYATYIVLNALGVTVPIDFLSVAYYLMLVNSTANSFVYSFLSRDFRQACWELLVTDIGGYVWECYANKCSCCR